MAAPYIPPELAFEHNRSPLEIAAARLSPDTTVLARVIAADTTAEAAHIIRPNLPGDGSGGGRLSKALVAATAAGTLAAPVVDALYTRPAAATAPETLIPAAASDPTPPQVVIFDDSIGVGRRDFGDEERKLEAAGLDVTVFDAVGGRQTVWEICDNNPSGDGCTKYPDVSIAMTKYLEQIAKATAVIIRTGTNDGVADLAGDLLRASREAVAYGTADGSQAPLIVLANTFGTSSYVSSDEKNPILRDVSAQLTSEGIPNTVIDYRTYVDNVLRPAGGMSRDEVHPNASRGYPMLADYDATIIPPLVLDYSRQMAGEESSSLPEVILPPVIIPTGDTVDTQTAPTVLPTPPLATSPSGSPDIMDLLSSRPDLLVVEPADVTKALSVAGIAANAPSASAVARPLSEPRPLQEDAPEAVINLSPDTVNQTGLVANVPAVDTSLEIAAEDLVPVSSASEPVIGPLQPARPLDAAPVSATAGEPSAPNTGATLPAENGEVLGIEEVTALAAAHGIFYDEQGKARLQLADFVDRQELPDLVITEGFADYREINGRTWRQGNVDVSTQSSTSGRRDVNLVSPGPGIYHEIWTEGEGLKVVIEFGISERTGNPWLFYNTHMSESIGAEGQIVDLGDVLGRAGTTGLVESANPIFSVGLTDQFTLEQLAEYANSREAVNPFDYSNPSVQFSCRQSALDDPGREFCGPTTPGVSYSLPVNSRVLAALGLPEQLGTEESEAGVVPDSPEQGAANPEATGVIVAIDPSDLDSIDVLVPAVDESALPEIVEPETTLPLPNEPSTPEDTPIIDVTTDTAEEDTPASGLPSDGLPQLPADNSGEPDSGAVPEPDSTSTTQPPTMPDDSAPRPPLPPASEQPSSEIPMRDIFTDAVIQAILPDAPIENIQAYTPLILQALQDFGIADPMMACYDFATIRPETGTFAPVPEISRGRGQDYGVPDPETGQTYYGRGFIQLTWKDNYRHYGEVLGLDLVNNPDLALDPVIAAQVMALYLLEHQDGIRSALEQGDYRAARQIVNGRAAHGLQPFTEAYQTCAAAVGI